MVKKKNTDIGNFWHIFAIFKPFTGTETLSIYFCLVEEVKNWLQE